MGPVTSDPLTIGMGVCPAPPGAVSTVQLLCDSGAIATCPGVQLVAYPRKNGQCTSPGKFQGDSPTTGVCMLPLAAQTTMPKPCEGGPSNP